MKYCADGGIIPGKEIVKGNSPKNDIKTIKVSPGEMHIIIDKETISKGPSAMIDFAFNQIKNNSSARKEGFDEGGTSYVNPNYQGVQGYFNQPSSDVPAQAGGNIVKPPDERIRQLEAIKNNLRPLRPDEAQEYNTLKAMQSQNMYCGGTVKGEGFSDGGTATAIDFQPSGGSIDFQPIQDSSLADKGQTALENYGNAISFGHLPQLQAATTKGLEAIGALPDGQSYVQERDANIARLAKESEENPKSAMAGKVAGIVNAAALPVPGTGLIKGAGIIPNIGRGAIAGAEYGAANNPGDVPGEVSPLQLKDRGVNAAVGAPVGAGTGLAAGLIGKGINAMKNSADAAQDFANTQAVRATGGMLKDMRQISNKGQVDDFGKFLLDNKIVEAGDSVHDVAEKANDFRKDAGQRLDDVYSQAKKEVGNNPDANMRGFSPSEDKSEILSKVEQKIGDDPNKSQAIQKVSDYLDDLQSKYGDGILDPKAANNIKTKVDQTAINYQRNPLAKDPASEQAFSVLRDHINDAVTNHVEDIGKATGSPELSDKLIQANKDYGMSRQAQNMAQDRVNREMANRMFSPSDYAAGMTGGMAGAVEGAAMGHPVEGAIAGLVAAPLNKVVRTYGTSTMASLANKAAPILEKTVGPVGEMLSKAPAEVLQKAATIPATNNYKSSGGYQKWYSDGLQNLIDHADNAGDKKMIQSMRSQLTSDPKGQQLLLQASSLKPGSKQMNQILSNIRGMK